MSREQVFEAVVPVDARGRSLLKQQLVSAISNALTIDSRRVQVLDFRTGSVVVLCLLWADPDRTDERTPEQLASILRADADQSNSEMRQIYWLESVEITDIVTDFSAQLPFSPSPLAASRRQKLETAKTARRGSLILNEYASKMYGAQNLFSHMLHTAAPPHEPLQTRQPDLEKARGAAGLYPDPSQSGPNKYDTTRLGAAAGTEYEDLDGMIEVFVLEARNLPADNLSRATVVLQVESASNKHSAALESLDMYLGRKAWENRHEDQRTPGYLHESQRWGRIWGGEEEAGVWMGGEWETKDWQWPTLELHLGSKGQTHRTSTQDGPNPIYRRGFRLRVRDRTVDNLRVQVLHRGSMATEFVGEVLVSIRNLVPVCQRYQADRDGLNNRLTEIERNRLVQIHHTQAAAVSSISSTQNSDMALLSQSVEGQSIAGERSPNTATLPRSEKPLIGGQKVRASWFPLLSPGGGKVQNNHHAEAELRLGFRWVDPVPKNLRSLRTKLMALDPTASGQERWVQVFFHLDPFEQVLTYATKHGQPLGHVSLRGASAVSRANDEKRRSYTQSKKTFGNRRGVREHTFAISTPHTHWKNATSMVLAASSEEEMEDWVESVNGAGGVAAAWTPPPPFCSVEARWAALPLMLLLAIAAAATGLYFLFLQTPGVPEQYSLPWGLCAPIGSLCSSCDCFKRCMTSRTIGFTVHVPAVHHHCARTCFCELPPPSGMCGDGDTRDVTIDWFGWDVVFPEQCDDGNTQDNDGCSSECVIEEYMMFLDSSNRVMLSEHPQLDGTRSLCGSNHTLSECETECVRSSDCACIWFGAGVCHLYPACPLDKQVAWDAELELTWMELEYHCGSYDVDDTYTDIRGSVILLGTPPLDATEEDRFTSVMHDYLQPCRPCRSTVVFQERGPLPEFTNTTRRSALQVQPTVARAWRKDPYWAERVLSDGGRGVLHSHPGTSEGAAPSAVFGTGSRGLRQLPPVLEGLSEDLDVLVLDFKVTVENATSDVIMERMRNFVAMGELGLVGRLKGRTPDGIPIPGVVQMFPDLQGVLWEPNGGEPQRWVRPGDPSEFGRLYRKVPYKCAPDTLPPRPELLPHYDDNRVPNLCCGNVSNVCTPVGRCYVSVANRYDCVPVRVPYAPTDIIGVPYDERVDLYWDPPLDNGGFPVLQYQIDHVEFDVAHNAEVGQNLMDLLFFDLAAITPDSEPAYGVTGLVNFHPYYFRISAINQLGTGLPSAGSPPIEPNVFSPESPSQGEGAVGNRVVWLHWRPSYWDGGREMVGYYLEFWNNTGRWYHMPLTDQIWTHVPPPDGVYTIAAGDGGVGGARRRLKELDSGKDLNRGPNPTQTADLKRKGKQTQRLRANASETQDSRAIGGARRRLGEPRGVADEDASNDDRHSDSHSNSSSNANSKSNRNNGNRHSNSSSSSSSSTGKDAQAAAHAAGMPLSSPATRRLLQQDAANPDGNNNNAQSMTTSVLLSTASPRNCSRTHAGREIHICDPFSTQFAVYAGPDGQPLVNAREYRFRLSAVNTFARSKPSVELSVTPQGEPATAVIDFTAECHESSSPNQCTQGNVGNRQLYIQWSEPVWDGGSSIFGYEIKISTDNKATFQDIMLKSRTNTRVREYTLSDLPNDVDHFVQVAALNVYGNGTVTVIGPLTPRNCPHMATCNVCVEPYYNIWGGGCSAPDCVARVPPATGPPATSITRLRDCSTSGCRVEVWYPYAPGPYQQPAWGTLDGTDTPVITTDVICREFGLRGRPSLCGKEQCTSLVYPAPVVGLRDQKVWLQAVKCVGGEESVHDCPANKKWGFDPATGVYLFGKWLGDNAQHARDLGACCWEPLEDGESPELIEAGASGGAADSPLTTPSPGGGGAVAGTTAQATAAAGGGGGMIASNAAPQTTAAA